MFSKALIASLAGHFLLISLIFFSFKINHSRSEIRSYPKILTATLITKPAPLKAAPIKKAAAPKPKKIKPVRRKKKNVAPLKQKQPDKSNISKPEDKIPSAEPRVQTNQLRLDVPDFPFPHYLPLLQFRIESQWHPPFSGRGHFLATVHFIILKNGNVQQAKIEKSSGNFAFDQAALRAVHNSNPLPAIPNGANLETLGIHFDFVANW